MDAHERERESDPNAVFIRVYSCPFAVEICSYRTVSEPPEVTVAIFLKFGSR